MGFLKNLGNSIKGVTKMVSLKNVVGVATGNAGGLAKELAGRVLKPHLSQPKVQIIQNSSQVQFAEDYVTTQSNAISNNLQNQLAKNNTTQGVASFMSKVYLKTMFAKYKTWFIVGGLAVTSTIVYFVWLRKKPKGRARR